MSYYEDLCKKVCEIVEKVGEFALKNWDIEFDYEIKSPHNYVTKIDKECENMLIENLSKILPTANFLAEETLSNSYIEGLTWIIDPLDGTTNYIHKLPPVAISVALYENNNPLIGVIYEISRKEIFFTWENSYSYLNNKKISVSKTEEIDKSLIITGFPIFDDNRIEEVLAALKYFFKNSSGVRRLGSAATDLAYVSCGRADAFYELNLNPWDVAAGALLVKNAGGKVSDFNGKKNFLFGKEIVSSNPFIYKELLEILQKIFKKKVYYDL